MNKRKNNRSLSEAHNSMWFFISGTGCNGVHTLIDYYFTLQTTKKALHFIL